VIGFDSMTRMSPVSFGLEVWSKLSGRLCSTETAGYGDGPFGGLPGFGGLTPREYGYTVFPHLRGGHLTGFQFDNGLVSFNIRGAQTRRAPQWNVGPYDLQGVWERLVNPVSRNTLFRQTLTPAPPPMEVCGIQEFEDVIHGGSASVTTDDVIDGGDASETSPWIIYGGAA
jgi:hypothetical protein